MAERDTQKSKLYKAERTLHAATWNLHLAEVKDVERFIKKTVGNRSALARRYGSATDFHRWGVTVHHGGGTRNAMAYGTRRINIPLWARNALVVLHELSHIVHARLSVTGYGRAGNRTTELAGGPAHGWQFAAIFIDLVHFVLGKECGDALKAAFKAGKVRFRAKRKSTHVGVNPFLKAA